MIFEFKPLILFLPFKSMKDQFKLKVWFLFAIIFANKLSASENFIHNPGPDELNFSRECLGQDSYCAYSRIVVLDNFDAKAMYLEILNSANSYEDIKGSKNIIWSQDYRCDRIFLESIEAHIVSSAGSHISSLRIEGEKYGPDHCRVWVVDDEIDKKGGETERVSIRYVMHAKAQMGAALYSVEYSKNALNRHIVFAPKNSSLHLYSPPFPTGEVLRGEIDTAIIHSSDLREIYSDHFIIFSTLENWIDFAKLYSNEESSNLKKSSELEKYTGKFDIFKAAKELKNKLAYKVSVDNTGIMPRRTFDQIISSEYADCKDYSLALVHLLRSNGVRATSVITSLKSPTPRSLIVPDNTWANHVVVYLPEKNLFIDLTQNEIIVDETSKVFGSIGYRVDTGEMIVIGAPE